MATSLWRLLQRELDQRRPERRLRQDAGRDPGRGGRVSRALPRRADLSEGTHPRGADRLRPPRSSCASSARICPSCAAKADEVKHALKDIPGLVDLQGRVAGGYPADRGQGGPRSRGALRPQAGRCAAHRGYAGQRHRGRGHLPRRQGVRRERVEHARVPQQRRRDPRSAASTRRAAGRCAWRTWPSVAHRADAERRSNAGSRSARSMSTPTSRARSRLRRRRRPAPAGRDQFPPGYHPELLGEYAEREAAQKKMLRRLDPGGDRDPAAAAGVVPRLAAGDPGLLDPALRRWSGGVLAASLGDGVVSLGSLVGFLTVLGIAARNGIMLISHYQHLERRGGDALRPGAGHSRRPRAHLADPDDRADHRRWRWCRC